ncbi:uncharacterized protein BDZ99DRAFT_513420 [Mytilinidion resinicola]|uniref:Uncharacterized protein n=1 Tax=Mytilinidion resinicola TaxID=574789 RepID=A0A6A6ZAD5_9PEZI|nr:uncharacterized protein BDZ99DRAFT_513420 [Mytilinidion resinicola]KAF2817167.1 hypothetical protein BDZ99DRAFT_513420 [Mytilinidion resinicola]
MPAAVYPRFQAAAQRGPRGLEKHPLLLFQRSLAAAAVAAWLDGSGQGVAMRLHLGKPRRPPTRPIEHRGLQMRAPPSSAVRDDARQCTIASMGEMASSSIRADGIQSTMMCDAALAPV